MNRDFININFEVSILWGVMIMAYGFEWVWCTLFLALLGLKRSEFYKSHSLIHSFVRTISLILSIFFGIISSSLLVFIYKNVSLSMSFVEFVRFISRLIFSDVYFVFATSSIYWSLSFCLFAFCSHQINLD